MVHEFCDAQKSGKLPINISKPGFLQTKKNLSEDMLLLENELEGKFSEAEYAAINKEKAVSVPGER